MGRSQVLSMAAAVGFACLSMRGLAAGQFVRERVGVYEDSTGVDRRRSALDAGTSSSGFASAMTQANYTVSYDRDLFIDHDLENHKYDRDIYQSSTHVKDSVTLTAGQTWHKLTETRVVAGYATDGQIKSRTGGVGAGHWFLSETLQANLDVSRTLTDQPYYPILDFDFEVVSPSTLQESTGATLGLKYLATSTTVAQLSFSEYFITDRPVTRVAALGLRQFVPQLNGAVHANGVRSYNRGRVTTDTATGSIDSWQAELAYLQSLWQGARAKLGYRFYREDETTRAYEDEVTLGSDMVTVGFAQELPKHAVDSLGVPLTIEANASRYETNTQIAARMFEVGVSSHF